MKCPTCGLAELVHDTRDMPYTFESETIFIPSVTGDFCPFCSEAILDAAESQHTMALMRAFRMQVHPTLRFQYAVRLAVAPEGGFVVTCRDLPQLVTQGEDIANALAEASDALEEVLVTYMQNGFPLPIPKPLQHGEYLVRLSSDIVAKASHYVHS